MDHLYFEPLAVAIWAAVILLTFVFVLIRVCGSLRQFRAYRRELVLKTQGLRIHRMLGRAGTTLSHYLRKAHPIEVELHLLACQGCETTDLCDKCLDQGEDIDPRTFCPNFVQLAAHGRRGKRLQLEPQMTSCESASAG
jgi:hypothetical protein